MQSYFTRLLGPAAWCSVLFLALWPLVGLRFATLALLGALAFYLARHLYWLDRLQRWLKKPALTDIPSGSGAWEDIFSGLYQELRLQERSQGQLSSALERLQRVASALPDGVVVLNAANEIEWCNPLAEQRLGLSLAKDGGHPIGYLLREAEFVDYLRSERYAVPLKIKSLRHPDLTLEIQLVPFGEDQKLLLCRDITSYEKLDTMRRDFIANVSHELRTPLTVVNGFLETLQDMESAILPETRRYFDLMHEQTARMRRLVEDLLTLSQLESSQNRLQESDIDVPALLQIVMAEAQSLSDGRHAISVEIEGKLHLKGAREELHSAFGNLVSNAIRYTPEGGAITLAWRPLGREAAFSVRDSGIGIEAQHVARLTERFYRVDRSRSRATGGTGLGLSIVKHIATRHQARLEIESEPGQGSIFRVAFPAERVILPA